MISRKQSSELAARLQADRNAKAEEKIKELQEFVARFSANASNQNKPLLLRKCLIKSNLKKLFHQVVNTHSSTSKLSVNLVKLSNSRKLVC